MCVARSMLNNILRSGYNYIMLIKSNGTLYTLSRMQSLSSGIFFGKSEPSEFLEMVNGYPSNVGYFTLNYENHVILVGILLSKTTLVLEHNFLGQCIKRVCCGCVLV